MEEENLCISCFETITHPICEWCYIKQITKWLEHAGINGIKKEKIIAVLKQNMTREMSTENTCILCHKEEVKICSYCFFLNIAKQMKKIKLSEDLIQSFLADFNYHNIKEDEFMSLIK
jgi:hypothetical protein